MPDGSALANTASTLHKMAQILRKIPEVVSIQTYAGTAKPFDFNGLNHVPTYAVLLCQGRTLRQLLDAILVAQVAFQPQRN
jgi:multidrug efflux pump subunit AcrB